MARLLGRPLEVEAVAPVQLSIRLLIPAGSHVLGIEGIRGIVDRFDPATLGHPWRNPDARVDTLQQSVQAWISRAEATGTPRREIFEGVWRLAWEALGEPAPVLDLASTGTANPLLDVTGYYPLTAPLGAPALAGVLDHAQPVLPGQGQDRVHVRRPPAKVHRQDGLGPGGDGGFDQIRIKVKGVFSYVN